MSSDSSRDLADGALKDNFRHMDDKQKETVKRLLIRLEDARFEVRNLIKKVDYPLSAKFDRVYDSLETAEKYLKESIDD